jgi:anti-sigma regulatory factor (Ser/Thr protein kinase)
LCTATGTVTDLSDKALPLGLRQTYQSKATTIALPDRSTLVLYTDGLTEATRDLIAGDALLHEVAAKVAATPWKSPAETLRQGVLGAAASDDDLAILVARFDFDEAEAGITRLTFDVRDADAARHARGVLVTTLTTRGFPPIEKLNAELVFSELIGNVLRHANTGAEVEISIDCTGPQTILHVLDRGLGFSHISRLPFDALSESGRGVFLVAQMTDDFTVSERPGGGSHVQAVLIGRLPRALQAEDVHLPSLLPAFT